MRRYITIILILLPSFFISGQIVCEKSETKQIPKNRVDSLLNILNSPNDTYIMVVAHRGNWSNAPENSLLAIRNAIAIGTDIVEIDVRLTKDKIPVLMHDKTLDRTTTGSGKLSNWTLNSLQELFLTDGNGNTTPYKIPTLEDALVLCKGKILINLDKCSMHLDRIVEYLQKTKTLNQTIIRIRKDFYRTRLHKKCSKKRLIYIPKIEEEKRKLNKLTKKYIRGNKPLAFDIDLTKEDSNLLPWVKRLKNKSCRIWISTTSTENVRDNTLKENQPSAITKWNWAVESDANIILTDEPALLIDYLDKKGLRKQKMKNPPNLNNEFTNFN